VSNPFELINNAAKSAMSDEVLEPVFFTSAAIATVGGLFMAAPVAAFGLGGMALSQGIFWGNRLYRR